MINNEKEGPIELNKIYNEDCLKGAKRVAPGSVDLILTDPPYGNMNTDGGRKLGIDGWDYIIDPADLHNTANRLLRKNGKMVLFSQEPYTSQLITRAIPNVPFSYRAIWEKDTFANALGVNKAMVSLYEDILLFSKNNPKWDFEGLHPLKAYSRKVFEFIGVTKSEINRRLGHQKSVHFFQFDGKRNVQFSLCTVQTYEELIAVFNIDRMDGFIVYDDLKEIDTAYRTELQQTMNDENPSTFNLWEGKKYKSNILKYKKDYTGLHPTQKPVALLEDLIKTFTNEGDTVVDLTIGSGSTAIACINTGRNFIGFELDEGYYNTAVERIATHREGENT